MVNQIDFYIGGRVFSVNIYLGLFYVSIYQLCFVIFISYGFDKFYIVDSGERNLEYGYQFYDYRGYVLIQFGGLQFYNLKWDVEFF